MLSSGFSGLTHPHSANFLQLLPNAASIAPPCPAPIASIPRPQTSSLGRGPPLTLQAGVSGSCLDRQSNPGVEPRAVAGAGEYRDAAD